MRYTIVAILLIIVASPVYAQCDVDYYSTRADGGLGYDGAVSFIICPLSCPADTTASNVNGSWQCVGLGSFEIGETICGNGLPCGQIPWSLPALEILASPTPYTTPAASANPEATAEVTIEPTAPVAEATDFVGALDSAQDFLTPIATPNLGVDASVEYQNVIADSATFFSYVRAIELADFGVLNPLIAAFFTLAVLTLLLNLALFLLPVLSMIVGVLRKLVQLIPGI